MFELDEPLPQYWNLSASAVFNAYIATFFGWMKKKNPLLKELTYWILMNSLPFCNRCWELVLCRIAISSIWVPFRFWIAAVRRGSAAKQHLQLSLRCVLARSYFCHKSYSCSVFIVPLRNTRHFSWTAEARAARLPERKFTHFKSFIRHTACSLFIQKEKRCV